MLSFVIVDSWGAKASFSWLMLVLMKGRWIYFLLVLLSCETRGMASLASFYFLSCSISLMSYSSAAFLCNSCFFCSSSCFIFFYLNSLCCISISFSSLKTLAFYSSCFLIFSSYISIFASSSCSLCSYCLAFSNYFEALASAYNASNISFYSFCLFNSYICFA